MPKNPTWFYYWMDEKNNIYYSKDYPTNNDLNYHIGIKTVDRNSNLYTILLYRLKRPAGNAIGTSFHVLYLKTSVTTDGTPIEIINENSYPTQSTTVAKDSTTNKSNTPTTSISQSQIDGTSTQFNDTGTLSFPSCTSPYDTSGFSNYLNNTSNTFDAIKNLNDWRKYLIGAEDESVAGDILSNTSTILDIFNNPLEWLLEYPLDFMGPIGLIFGTALLLKDIFGRKENYFLVSAPNGAPLDAIPPIKKHLQLAAKIQDQIQAYSHQQMLNNQTYVKQGYATDVHFNPTTGLYHNDDDFFQHYSTGNAAKHDTIPTTITYPNAEFSKSISKVLKLKVPPPPPSLPILFPNIVIPGYLDIPKFYQEMPDATINELQKPVNTNPNISPDKPTGMITPQYQNLIGHLTINNTTSSTTSPADIKKQLAELLIDAVSDAQIKSGVIK